MSRGGLGDNLQKSRHPDWLRSRYRYAHAGSRQHAGPAGWKGTGWSGVQWQTMRGPHPRPHSAYDREIRCVLAANTRSPTPHFAKTESRLKIGQLSVFCFRGYVKTNRAGGGREIGRTCDERVNETNLTRSIMTRPPRAFAQRL